MARPLLVFSEKALRVMAVRSRSPPFYVVGINRWLICLLSNQTIEVEWNG
jgi:hypothetical protein